jgi:hypothetical protein
MSFSSTSNCGSDENAEIEINKIIEDYQDKGYIISKEEAILTEEETFDKAKWHLNDEFPKELDMYQAYIHTGFYIGWLIKNDLISSEFKKQSESSINIFLNRKITCVKLYEEQLDGIFTSNDVNDIGLKFTKNYFDFSNGQYLDDYEKILAKDLPSLFYVKDTWENFDKIFNTINERYLSWKGISKSELIK